MLIVLSGLPATGKSTVAQALAAQMPALYLRIDEIEHALRASGALAGDVGTAGYKVAYALAGSNLRLGRSVIADGVNPLPVTRAAWRQVAALAGTAALEVEPICSDTAQHRQRAEARSADIAGHAVPSWAAVCAHHDAPWDTQRLLIDTARLDAQAAADTIAAAARQARTQPAGPQPPPSAL